MIHEKNETLMFVLSVSWKLFVGTKLLVTLGLCHDINILQERRVYMADTNDMTLLSQEEIDKLIKKMEEEKNS